MPVDRELDEQIERYLDGELSAAESVSLEHELAAPEAAAALSTALFLREALREAGPAEPPTGLQNRILEVLSLETAPPAWETARESEAPVARATGRVREWSASARSAAQGMAFAWRGPALAVNALSAGTTGTSATLAGLATARWALGPLATAASARTEPKRPPRSWWRRLLSHREET
ncbi:MAG: hypothetical protein JXB32_17210 [Deltaproteobacteria bacterium]|nr:hypothetical protein [Deltaproteobacteria bacterium]